MAKVKAMQIHHLGFVVRNLDDTLRVWESLFGIVATVKENPDLQVRLGSISIAGVNFVFNESTHPESRWAKFLEENGEGLEHVAFEVSDIDEACQVAKDLGIGVRFDQHKPIHGLLTNFVDKDKAHATAVEFMGPEKI